MKTTNIMSVDLEDYFCDLPFEQWSKYQSKIETSTELLLELFEKHNVKATFFTVGYIAEKFPKLIKKIHDIGHELGSHTYAHIDLRRVSRIEFEKDLLKSINVIEKNSGQKILGFRAPFFSINSENFWVFDILRKYFKYDSSIFPIRSPLYGMPKAPRTIYCPSLENPIENDMKQDFVEIPPLVYRILNYNLPVAGGFYLRLFPSFFIKNAIKKFNEENNPAMFYIHPKDLIQDMPKIKEYSWHYYFGKRNIVKKFEDILDNFNFSTAKQVLGINES